MRPFLTLASAALLTAVVGVSSASAGFLDLTGVSLVKTDPAAAGLPGAETRPASNIGDDTARMNGKVDPHERPTTYHFDWGQTSGYGSRTTDTAAGRGDSGVSAAATIGGLRPGTTYHFRIVAENDAGTTRGADRTFTTTGAAAPDDPAGTPGDPGTGASDPGTGASDPGTAAGDPGSSPDGTPGDPDGGASTPGDGTTPQGDGALGSVPPDTSPGAEQDAADPFVIGGQAKKHREFAVAPTAGHISVNPPGPTGFQPLVEGVSVPVGSIVDARNGTAAITTELDSGRKQTAEFWGERFKVRQPVEEGGLTEIRVRDAVRACDGKSISAVDKVVSARKKRRRGGLWGRDAKGRWRTHGRGSQATTRGTIWFSEERCDGTYTKVVKGSVLVRDHYLKRNVVVNAGGTYLAHPHRKHKPSLR
ncbi:MAG TPA: hypothetical protein VF517_16725 [Thermoleophilaceae bacterium]